MATTLIRQQNLFTDLDISFARNSVSGDVEVLRNEQAIKQAVKLLILTQIFERPFHSEIGSPVNGLLFENSNPLLISMIRRVVQQTLQNFEPRIEVTNIQVTDKLDQNQIDVTLEFNIVGTTTSFEVDFNIERTR
jgi:phage baseplate assembly protein W